ncbi:glycoside hydrolase family 25 protein [Acinetobacter lwoffii]|jgi:lysozyme|uniref:glycoside hydrolase family 25 protein n=1 Tax=Acinetobacter lwoffii TaxID=28090 RepID=UPI00209B5D05|nr:glycoside hydrolase family 25 protein [Acinetobacter lwoffii]MCO8080114.1 glycoside hydrolase family 25 protein [Acinetobacter lwoffii]MCO8094987.1 glycoside hydrolase family 25 protein [Acinetobacter lwoffii]
MQKNQAPNRVNKSLLIGLGVLITVITIAMVYLCLMKAPSAHAADYPIQGFDVSHHQKEIQWQQISPEKYRFVYLKATEGGDFKDTRFQENWLKARERGFLVGAYHFYRLCRDGSIQAQNFIDSVPNKPDALPPVIDLEYDSKCINTYSKEQLLNEIQVMHDALKKHYGKQPIFYISKAFYNIVLAGHFPNVPLWVREYKGLPDLKDQPKWTFWQHTSQGKIPGITTPVDLNVFYGSEQQWLDFLKKNAIVVPSSENKAK